MMGPTDAEAAPNEPQADDFRIWTAGQPEKPGHMGMAGATLKLGPKVCKTISVAAYGDSETGELKKRELRVATFDRQEDGTFDFDHPATTWYVENEEIERLLAFLNQDVEHPGRYKVVDALSPLGEIVDLVKNHPDQLGSLVEALSTGAEPGAFAMALARTGHTLSAAEMAIVLSRRELLARAEGAAARDGVTEREMQETIGQAWWIFGGRYVGVVPRRQLLQLDEFDIPLVVADGSLHIVELKGPDIPGLIRRHRNHWIVGDEIHKATMQATNYVRTADELGASAERNLRQELGIDVDLRRVSATVVIGHRDHTRVEGMPPGQFDLALRTYNGVLNRVQVVTYDQLFDAARRSLVFEGI